MYCIYLILLDQHCMENPISWFNILNSITIYFFYILPINIEIIFSIYLWYLRNFQYFFNKQEYQNNIQNNLLIFQLRCWKKKIVIEFNILNQDIEFSMQCKVFSLLFTKLIVLACYTVGCENSLNWTHICNTKQVYSSKCMYLFSKLV